MSATILIVDDDEHTRLTLKEFVSRCGYEAICVATLEETRKNIRQGTADVILLDVQLPDGYGPSLLEEVSTMPIRPPIILITGYGDIETAVEAMKNGAHDFLEKPITLTNLEKSIQRATEIVSMRRELAHLRQARSADLEFIIGDSPAMKALVDLAQRAAQMSVSVLITGDTGTGKDVLANYIHKVGSRSDKPFIPINTAAIQNTILESELFGYEAGAFTNAEKRKYGLMEIADGGILFLDEISSMSADMQAKLLRAIEEHAFRRVGGTNLIRIDIQVLAASNRDLQALISQGAFREDLYYRLKVIDLHLPPLRERKEDIPAMVGLFIRQNNPRMGLNIEHVTPRAMEALMNYDWPGNVRQLRHVIERAMLLCDDPAIDLPHLPPEVLQATDYSKS